MIVSKNSWHYRLADGWVGRWDDPAGSLCLYFWQVVFGAMKLTGLIGGIIVLIVLVCVAIYGFFKIAFMPFVGFVDMPEAIASCLVWVVFGLLFWKLITELADEFDWDIFLFRDIPIKWSAVVPPVPSAPEPVVSFFKMSIKYLGSIKQKVCPTLKFK
jgi:hypothetical protein